MSEQFKWALQNGDTEKVSNLISQNKAIVNESFEGQRPPLNIAADYGQTEVIALLIDNGADINAKDSNGITPLLSAIFEGHTAAVKLLLTRGADKTLKAPSGDSYIDVAEKKEIKDLLS